MKRKQSKNVGKVVFFTVVPLFILLFGYVGPINI